METRIKTSFRQRLLLPFVSAFAFLAVVTAPLFAQARSEPKPQEVTFPSGKLQLHRFLWRPDGPGPFAAVLWNHGSEKLPGWRPALGAFYTAHNYVFFIPHRRGQGRPPGEYIEDVLAHTPAAQRNQRMVELQEAEVEDVVTAMSYLKSLPFVDRDRIAISGCSYGGIQTLLAGERNLEVKFCVHVVEKTSLSAGDTLRFRDCSTPAPQRLRTCTPSCLFSAQGLVSVFRRTGSA